MPVVSFVDSDPTAASPQGEAIRSVTHLVPACHHRPGCGCGLPQAGLPSLPRRTPSSRLHGSQKAFSASPGSFSSFYSWLTGACASVSNLALTPGLVESPKCSRHLAPCPCLRAWGCGENPPGPFSSAGSCVQTPCLAHGGFPQVAASGPHQRRAPDRRPCPAPLRARRPWPACTPAPWWR